MNITTIRPIKKRVLATLCEQGARMSAGGIHLLDDDGKDHGIRPRWFQVTAIGPDQDEVEVGDYILVEHGRWTWGVERKRRDNHQVVEKIRMIDETGIIGKQKERPNDVNLYDNENIY